MKKATRAAYGEALAEYGSNERIIVLDADLSKSTMTAKFQELYPERFFNTGIAEANMISSAAGIATCGKIVFASSFAIFAAVRAAEQIRNSVCYPRLNVKIAATHAGISVGEDGATHQAIEDIAVMRALPNLTVIQPCDGRETKQAVKAIIDYDGPVYLRLGRLPVEDIYDNSYEFAWGKGVQLKDGCDVTIIATGLMVGSALEAYEMLKAQGILARVINIHTIKPIDREIIVKAAKETGAVVTAEEHTIIGGLGSAVCEVLSEEYPVPVKRIGIEDKFGKSGKPNELLKLYGLTAEDIAIKAKNVMALKRK
ncbi:MAG TPA: transketolase family protein [Clostridia bacterium]|jgi:transketolase|nr:MAG: 1-deoxy-D-xylulose-5-phosphate synthase [Firmicutes bacterium ADurb.Bin099]HNZ41271.1 transketolase family protein [Clostridia bacterium]HPY98513.1 transketolase family protein [Clostridia bacterium]HQC68480.1 transketolase family protein [Clostridia bacterium]